MQEFRWEDLDHKLADAKLLLLAGDMQKKVADDERRVHFEAAKSGNSAYFFSAFFKAQQTRAHEWAKSIYEVYRDVWQLQGHQTTPEFARTVYEKAVLPVISVRTGTAEYQANLIATRTRKSGKPQLTASIAKWHREMARLVSSVWKEIEVDARERQHASNAKKEDNGEVRPNQTMNIHIHNSQVGNLNLGTQVGTINATVQSLSQGDDQQKEFAQALKQLTKTVLSEQNLQKETQQEIVDMLSTLAEQAAKKPTERSKGTLKAVLSSLPPLITVGTKLAELWPKYEPTVRHFLGM